MEKGRKEKQISLGWGDGERKREWWVCRSDKERNPNPRSREGGEKGGKQKEWDR